MRKLNSAARAPAEPGRTPVPGTTHAQRPETTLPLGLWSKCAVWTLALGRGTEDGAENKSPGKTQEASCLLPDASVPPVLYV